MTEGEDDLAVMVSHVIISHVIMMVMIRVAIMMVTGVKFKMMAVVMTAQSQKRASCNKSVDNL